VSEPDPIDPYQPPASDVASGPSHQQAFGEERTRAVLGFLSTSGSFSRGELLIATAMLVAIGVLFSTLHRSFPDILPLPVLKLLRYGLYGVWGIALGKRSRDLGTTFTYGMIVGLLFPVIGLVFLFQEGAKERAKKSLFARPPKP
jgi:hypothetical protein